MSKNSNRDNFSKKTIDTLCKRVNAICSNPECNRGTLAPSTESDKVINTGVAAHISAASPGGPRYDKNMNIEQRTSIENGIWLCQTCSKLIDSDPLKYTSEILYEWKKKAELRASTGLVKPIYEPTESDKKVFEIIEDTYKDVVFLKENVKDEKNYSELYKDYIAKFSNLNNFLYSTLFLKKVQEDNFDDLYFNFGKNVINWLVGRANFPTNINDFYVQLAKDFNFTNDSIIKKRWEAIISYFNGDIENSNKIYINILDNVKDSVSIPSWFKDDIYIDGRNICILLDNLNSRYSLNNIFQNEIDKNNHKLSFPEIDRLKYDMYNQTMQNIYKYKNKSRGTIFYGIGLDILLNSLQELIYISILYGSITQLRLIREFLGNIFYLYSDCYKDEKFYMYTLKMKLLSGQFDDYKKLYNVIKYKYDFVNSSKYIDELYSLKNALLSFDNDSFACFFFEVYGRLIDASKFSQLENSIINILDDNREINPNIVSKALKSIPNNLNRFSKKTRLFNLMIAYVEKKYSRFYIDFVNIINTIKIEKLTSDEQKVYVLLVNKCFESDEFNYDISNALINIRETLKIDKFNDYLNKDGTSSNILKDILTDNNSQALNKILDIKIKQAEQREKNPDEHIGYMITYTLNSFFEDKREYYFKYGYVIKNKMYYLTKKTLLSKNQYASSKIDIIRSLCLIAKLDIFQRNKIKKIIKLIEVDSAEEHFSISKSAEEVNINIKLLKCFIGENSVGCFLDDLLLNVTDNNDLLVEALDCLALLIKNKNISSKDLYKVYLIYLMAINKRELILTKKALHVISVFIKTKYCEEIKKHLSEIIKYNNYDEIVYIVEFIRNSSSKCQEEFYNIVSLMESSNNYNVRYIVKKYLLGGSKK